MTDEFVVWGARDGNGIWRVELGKPVWSFDRAELERRLLAYGYEIEPLPDHLVARVPEAADALVRFLTIRKLRREVSGDCWVVGEVDAPDTWRCFDAAGNVHELGVCGGDCDCG